MPDTLNRRRRTCLQALLCSVPTISFAQEPVQGKTLELRLPAPKLGANDEPILIRVYQAAAWQDSGPVWMVMHGAHRNGLDYLRHWQPQAAQAGALLIVPELGKEKFPDRYSYNWGNVLTPKKNPLPRDMWLFAWLDRIFLRVREHCHAKTEHYVLYGHSAGAQMAHRYLLLAQAPRASLVIAANAGAYTMPDFNTDFPWGLRRTGLDEKDLRAALSRTALIALGAEDTDTEHPGLPHDAPAQMQGPHRYARGQYFLQAAQQRAAAYGLNCGWKLLPVPGVGHSDSGMGRAVAAELMRQAQFLNPAATSMPAAAALTGIPIPNK